MTQVGKRLDGRLTWVDGRMVRESSLLDRIRGRVLSKRLLGKESRA